MFLSDVGLAAVVLRYKATNLMICRTKEHMRVLDNESSCMA